MMNIRNFGIATGRLGRDPKVFTNQDGSKKVLLSLAVRQNYKGEDGKRGVDWVDLEAFVPATVDYDKSVYGYLRKGLQVTAQYSVVTNAYVDKEGNSQRKQVLRINNIDLSDTTGNKSATTAAAPIPAEMAEPIAAMPADAPMPGDDDEFDR